MAARRARHESRQHAQVLTLFPKLGERRGQAARTMSGGEQQMVAIGRALMSNPRILMLDEPSLGLSPLLTRELFRSLRAIRETGVGILLVEQNARQSLAIADRGYLLENGHITGEDRADKLARDPAVQAAYLGGAAATVQPLAHTTRVEANVVEAGGEPTAPAMPAASPPPASMAEALARRAAAIQRGHVEKMRTGVAPAPSQMNGRAYGVIHKHIVPGEKIVMSQQAEELSRHAGEFANRARQIQAAHLAETRRKTAIWTVLSTPAFTGPAETVAETAVEGKKAKKVKKAEKKARAAARKLHKAEEKVIKLAGQLAGKLAD